MYVDDIILIGDHTEEIARIKTARRKEFEVKDLRKHQPFLGMEVTRSK